MNKFIYFHSLLFICIILICNSCTDAFIPDPIDPRLPKYTEDGIGYAGALIENKLWLTYRVYEGGCQSGSTTIEYYNEKDSLLINMKGDSDSSLVDLNFSFKSAGIKTSEDLYLLKGRKIQFDGNQNSVSLLKKDTTLMLQSKSNGQIFFKSVKDGDYPNQVILSGTFGFTITQANGQEIEVSYGRFDFACNKIMQLP